MRFLACERRYERCIRVFDITRPGRQIEERPTTKNRKAKDGQRGIISCIAFAPGIYINIVYSYIYIQTCSYIPLCLHLDFDLNYIDIHIHKPEGEGRPAWNYVLHCFRSRCAVYTYIYTYICFCIYTYMYMYVCIYMFDCLYMCLYRKIYIINIPESQRRPAWIYSLHRICSRCAI